LFKWYEEELAKSKDKVMVILIGIVVMGVSNGWFLWICLE